MYMYVYIYIYTYIKQQFPVAGGPAEAAELLQERHGAGDGAPLFFVFLRFFFIYFRKLILLIAFVSFKKYNP